MVSWTASEALQAAVMAAILSWGASYAVRLVRTWWMSQAFPGPTGWPLMGSVPSLFTDEEKLFNVVIDTMKNYGGVARIWFGPVLAIFVGSAEDSRLILNNPTVISRNDMMCHLVNGFIDRSLVSTKGEIARLRRKMMTPAFNAKYLVSYFEVFTRKGEQLCEQLNGYADGRIVDIKDVVSVSLLDAFYETFFGVDMDWPAEKYAQVSREIVEANVLVFKRAFRGWEYLDWTYALSPDGRRMAQMRANFKANFKEGLAKNLQLKNSNDRKDDGATKKPCILDVMYELMSKSDEPLTEDEICEECYFMVMAVVETTAKAMAYTLMLLGMNPEVQEQAIEEQRTIFHDSLRPVNEEDIKNMPVLERIIKESMRLFPPIGGLTRNAPKDVKLSGGRVIPAGSTVLVSNFFVHRDASNFEDPERFWPDRWKVENSSDRHPSAFFPFGGGVRQCIAQKYSQMHLKVSLSRILRQFRFNSSYTMSELRRIRINLSNISVLGYDVQVYKREGTCE